MALEWASEDGVVIRLTERGAAIVHRLIQQCWFDALSAAMQARLISLVSSHETALKRLARNPQGQDIAMTLLQSTEAQASET